MQQTVKTDDQLSAFDKLSRLRVGALFMRPGTGKTRVAVELINTVPNLDLILWLGPLSSVRPRIQGTGTAAEISKWGGITNLHLFGIESLSQSDRIYLEVRELLRNAKKAFMIVDESLKIKNWSARRTQRIIDLGRLSAFRLILNGTPFSRDLRDLWPQMQFLSPKILNLTEHQFLRRYCEVMKITESDGVKVRTRQFVVGHANIEHLYSLIAPYIFEADLNLNVRANDFQLDYRISGAERDEYTEIKAHYLSEERAADFGMNFFLAMTQKMQMSYCVSADKFEVVKNLFNHIDAKETLIFCKFVRSREEVAKAFPASTALSLQKDVMSLNLQNWRNIIFWDRTWDWAAIDQAKHRILRLGQLHDCRYYHLHANTKLDGLISSNNDRKMTQIQYFNNVSKSEIDTDV